MSNELSNDNGFTLLELLIALTIFSVGLLAIAGLQINAIRHNSGSNLRTSITAVAQGVMEQVMSMDSDDPLFSSSGTNAASIVQTPSAGTITANWVVTVDTPLAGISRIDVNVQEASGRTITLTNFKRYNL